jgi:hypothetical protein
LGLNHASGELSTFCISLAIQVRGFLTLVISLESLTTPDVLTMKKKSVIKSTPAFNNKKSIVKISSARSRNSHKKFEKKLEKEVATDDFNLKEKVANEIDTIFSSAKDKKNITKSYGKNKNLNVTNIPVPELNDDFYDSRGERKRKVFEGLLVYSEKELKLGQGGSAPDCPFDCSCCY